MSELTVGTKLIRNNKYNKWDIEIDFIKRVNEKSYSLELGWKIDKVTMKDKWNVLYSIPTKEQLDFIEQNSKKQALTKIAEDFNFELNDTIETLEILEKHSDVLELSSAALENIENCIANLKEELEEEKK